MNLETSIGCKPVFLSTSNLLEIKNLNFTNSNLGVNNIISYPNSTNELQSQHVYVLKAVNAINRNTVSNNSNEGVNQKTFNAESFQIAIQNNLTSNVPTNEQRFMLRPLKVALDPNQATQLSNLCKIETTSTNPVAFVAKVLSFPKSQSGTSNSIVMTPAQISSMEHGLGKKLIPVIVPLPQSQTTNSDMVAMPTAITPSRQLVSNVSRVRTTAVPILPKPQPIPTPLTPPTSTTYTTNNAQGMLMSNTPQLMLGNPMGSGTKLLAAPMYLNIRAPATAPSPTFGPGGAVSYKVIKPQPILTNQQQQQAISVAASCQTETNRLLSEILVGGTGPASNNLASNCSSMPPVNIPTTRGPTPPGTARSLYYYGATVRILPQPDEQLIASKPTQNQVGGYINPQGVVQSHDHKQQQNLKIPMPSPNIGTNNEANLKGGSSSNGGVGGGGKKRCNCTKSQCLKLYCECFASGEFCQNCNCNNCSNNLQHEDDRKRAIKGILERNPLAFHPKIGKSRDGEIERKHCKGCNCRRSGCLKNYCECYEAKIACSSKCKCIGCKNFEDSLERRSIAYLCGGAINSHSYFLATPRPEPDNVLFGNAFDEEEVGSRNHNDYANTHPSAVLAQGLGTAGDIWRDFENSSLLAAPPFDSPLQDRAGNKAGIGPAGSGIIDTLSAYLLSPSLHQRASQPPPPANLLRSRDCFINIKDEDSSSQDVHSREGAAGCSNTVHPFSSTSQILPTLVVPSNIITDEIVEAIVTCMVAQAYENLLPPQHQYKNGETTARIRSDRYDDLERAVTREFGQCLTRIINVAKNSPFKANPTTPLVPHTHVPSHYEEDERARRMSHSPKEDRRGGLLGSRTNRKQKHPYGTRRNCASKYGGNRSNVDFEDGSRSTITGGHTRASGSSLIGGSSSELSLSSDME